jgi:hypothetical protein
MTAQFPEKIQVGGKVRSMCTDPLDMYFELAGIGSGFKPNSTALWRGYVGTWEILDARLYLIDLTGTLKSGQEARLETIFPGFPDRVFAHWYSGKLRIPMGELLRYVHGGYGSVYERDQFITVKKGVTVATCMVVNGEVPGSDTTEDAYAVHAMYTFASNSDNNREAP